MLTRIALVVVLGIAFWLVDRTPLVQAQTTSASCKAAIIEGPIEPYYQGIAQEVLLANPELACRLDRLIFRPMDELPRLWYAYSPTTPPDGFQSFFAGLPSLSQPGQFRQALVYMGVIDNKPIIDNPLARHDTETYQMNLATLLAHELCHIELYELFLDPGHNARHAECATQAFNRWGHYHFSRAQ